MAMVEQRVLGERAKAGPATRSPTATECTSGPTAATSPANSRPAVYTLPVLVFGLYEPSSM